MISENIYLSYFVGLFLILVTPGPNFLLIGTLSALYGIRSVAPLLLGIAAGQTVLASALYGLGAFIPDGPKWNAFANSLEAILIAMIAWRLFDSARFDTPIRNQKISQSTHFSSGFVTAVSNPIAGLYLASQFLGPLNDINIVTFLFLLALYVCLAILVNFIVAFVMSHDMVRLRFQRSIRVWTQVTAIIFFLIALRHLEPVISIAGGM